MSNNSNVKQPENRFEIDDHSHNYNPHIYLTISAIEDELTCRFSSKCGFQIDSQNNIHLNRKYLEYAERFLYRINLIRPAPKFELSWQDIPKKLQEHLAKLDAKSLNDLLTNVVRNILESVNPVYYHTNGIYGKVKWRIID